MNHYPRHIGDWMRDTAHLSEMEECYYSRLVDQYYIREKPLPAPIEQCCRLVRAASAAARRVVSAVLAEFFTLHDDGWHQKRCDQELAAYFQRSASASKSAQVRWSERNANAYANAPPNGMRTHCVGNASQKPVASSHKPEKGEVQEQRGADAPLPAKSRAKRLPDDWSLPNEWCEWAMAERPDWDETTALRVSLEFRDHWLGKGEARADWLATWRNWVRRERSIRGKAAAPNKQEALEKRNLEVAARLSKGTQ